MAKGLIINKDVWESIAELNPDECRELLTCLSEYCLGEETQETSRFVRVIYKRITLDNERSAKLSAKRAEAGRVGGSKSKQTEANVSKCKQTEANASKVKQNSTEEEKERSKEREEAIDINTHSINNTSSSVIKRSVFIPPTIEQIKAYAEEKGYSKFNPEQFWNFYESKNWMVGKNKMANWKSAVSGWALRDKQKLAESAKPTTDYKAQLSKLDYGALLRK